MSIFQFAKRCILCHEVQAATICAACTKDLSQLLRTHETCPHCGAGSLHRAPCLACQSIPAPYDYFWASAHYVTPLPALLHRWKHARQSTYVAVFQWLMRANPPTWLPECQADAVLAMPISRQRRLQRGFNQCDELAHWVTQHYNIPLLAPESVHRAHRTAQSSLGGTERAENIIGAFTPNDNVINRKILIIDDICTTQSTLAELAGSLHQSGASAVFAWVVACNERKNV